MSESPPHGPRVSGARGRPRLGVVGREVTLLPEQWEWLKARPGGASVALRTLIDAARGSGAASSTTSLSTPRPRSRPLPACLAALVPADRHGAVRRCLDAAFAAGTDAVSAAVRLPGGAAGAAGAAIVLRLTVRNDRPAREADYVMRIEGPVTAFRDPRRHYACWRLAATARVAPRLLQADAEAGIAIGEFLEPMPPSQLPARADRIRAILTSLKRLHAAPLFPAGPPYVDVIDSLLGQCRSAGILMPDVLRGHLALHGELTAAYRRLPPELVSSHNDPNPSNIVFARRRAWLVDWESAFAADRYIDLAVLINFHALNRYDEEMILRHYFGPELTERHRARAFLMQQLNRLFYALVLLNGVAAARPETRLTAADLGTAPRFVDVRGELPSLATVEGRLRFGGVFLNEMKCSLESPRFAESVQLLATGSPSAAI